MLVTRYKRLSKCVTKIYIKNNRIIEFFLNFDYDSVYFRHMSYSLNIDFLL